MSTKLMEEVERSGESTWPPKARAMPSGAAVAALMAAMLGMLALAVVNVFTAASKPFNTWVHDVGKLWMPGAAGIGPYSGKETISLLVLAGGVGPAALRVARTRDAALHLAGRIPGGGGCRDHTDLAAGVRVSGRPLKPGEPRRAPPPRRPAHPTGRELPARLGDIVHQADTPLKRASD